MDIQVLKREASLAMRLVILLLGSMTISNWHLSTYGRGRIWFDDA